VGRRGIEAPTIVVKKRPPRARAARDQQLASRTPPWWAIPMPPASCRTSPSRPAAAPAIRSPWRIPGFSRQRVLNSGAGGWLGPGRNSGRRADARRPRTQASAGRIEMPPGSVI